jgi:deazaflavin-dependent oxidoreductase (nitroreductase family)
MTTREAQPSMARAPALVRLLNPLARRLLGTGLPMGPDTLLTVRGRTSGLPRTVPVAVLEDGGRRWLIGAYGDVNWVRNLRAAREGTIRVGGRPQRVGAVELGTEEAAAFFRDVLTPYVHRQPLLLRSFVTRLLRGILADPEAAASRYPVFELHVQPG